MNLVKKLINISFRTLKILLDFLIPENKKISQLLKLDSQVMKKILPKSVVNQKDTIVLFDYKNKVVRYIVKNIKYKNNQNLRKRIASYLYEEIMEFFADELYFFENPPILVPIPMGKKERRKRGFNQCEEICEDIFKMSGDNMKISKNILIKTRETERQTSLSKEKRILNVKNSMKANKEAEGKTIILIDDVYTTGSTMEEARRALYTAGAKRVINVFIAH